jgi:hypothetical protein
MDNINKNKIEIIIICPRVYRSIYRLYGGANGYYSSQFFWLLTLHFTLQLKKSLSIKHRFRCLLIPKGERVRIIRWPCLVENIKNIGNELELIKSRMMAELVAERLIDIKYLDTGFMGNNIRSYTYYDEEKDGHTNGYPRDGVVSNRIRRSVSFEVKRDTRFYYHFRSESTDLTGRQLFSQIYTHRSIRTETIQLNRKQSTSCSGIS